MNDVDGTKRSSEGCQFSKYFVDLWMIRMNADCAGHFIDHDSTAKNGTEISARQHELVRVNLYL